MGAINDDREEVEPGRAARNYPQFSSDEPDETTHEPDSPRQTRRCV
jgi:hypothetical protein